MARMSEANVGDAKNSLRDRRLNGPLSGASALVTGAERGKAESDGAADAAVAAGDQRGRAA